LVLLAAAFPAGADERVLELDSGEKLSYRVIDDAQSSARPVAMRLLEHLAAAEIEPAALLSTAPRRRYEVLREYLASVGESEFKRVFGQYLFPENRVVAEVAIGPRRLIIWELGEAGHRLTGQYYVEIEGKFLMDDAPSEERSRLRRVLEAYRAGKIEK
jgi:hypothetical protein